MDPQEAADYFGGNTFTLLTLDSKIDYEDMYDPIKTVT